MERKELKFDRVDVDAAGTFEGYASTFGNVDFQNDEVVPGAFANGLDGFLKRGYVGWQHDGSPIAYPITAREDAHGLHITARFHSTPDGQRARTIAAERVAAGKTMSMSIGYTVRPGGARKRANGVRELRDVELHEVSLVLIPANELATVTAVKSHAAAWTDAERYAIRDRALKAVARTDGLVLRAEHRRLMARVEDLGNADFFEVIPSYVPSKTRATVTAVLSAACRDLGIDVPRVRYFRPGYVGERDDDDALARKHGIDTRDDDPIAEGFRGRKDLGGQAIAARGEVWIRSDLSHADLVYVVAHEARHIAQGQVGSTKALDGWAERDAHDYGLGFSDDWGSDMRTERDTFARLVRTRAQYH